MAGSTYPPPASDRTSGGTEENFPKALPSGTPLGGIYIVDRVLGQGGFGITYLAHDRDNQSVAIKEFFPKDLADRVGTSTVRPFTSQASESFSYVKQTFQDEANALSNLRGVPNIASVYRYFEENGTGYFSMEYVQGETFEAYLEKRGGKISFAETERILLPIMGTMSAVHARGVIHRDIKPENIMIEAGGVPKLLDFGAARQSLGERSGSLDQILTPGYAPYEQYSRRGRQGAYSDVYAIAATFYRAITGVVPPDSVDRVENDTLEAPSALGVSITSAQEAAILKGLAVFRDDRYQSMEEFRVGLLGERSYNYGGSTGADAGQRTQTSTGGPSDSYFSSTDSAGTKDNATQGEDTHHKKRGGIPRWLIPVAAAAAIGIAVWGIGQNSPDTSELAGHDFSGSTETDDSAKSTGSSEGFGEKSETTRADEETSQGNSSGVDTENIGVQDEQVEQESEEVPPAQVQVVNNGGNFVQVGDKVYFRRYWDNSLAKTAIWGDFLDYPTGEASSICYYDTNTGKTAALFSDNGAGGLYYNPNQDGFYVSRWISEEYGGGDDYHVWFLSLDGETKTDIGAYQIAGASEDGSCLALWDRSGEGWNDHLLLYRNGIFLCDAKAGNDEIFEFCGLAGDQLIYLVHNQDTDNETVWQLDSNSGNTIRLGVLPQSEDTYAGEMVQFLADGSTIHLIFGWYAGTGHFLDHYSDVRASLNTADNLDIYENPWNLEEAESELPKIYLANNGTASYSLHEPGEAVLSESLYGDLMYYETSARAITLISDFIQESPYSYDSVGYGQMPLAIETVEGNVFIILASTNYNADASIGWRDAYDRMGLYYLRVPVQEKSSAESIVVP